MRVSGVVTRVNDGVVGGNGKRAGSEWQLLVIEGITVFVPVELQQEFCRGQRVRAELMYLGDRAKVDDGGKVTGYQANYDLLSIEVIPDRGFE